MHALKEIEELYPEQEARQVQVRLKFEEALRLRDLAILICEELRADIEIDEALMEQELLEQRLRSRRRCRRT